jgi:hypothetical protein
MSRGRIKDFLEDLSLVHPSSQDVMKSLMLLKDLSESEIQKLVENLDSDTEDFLGLNLKETLKILKGRDKRSFLHHIQVIKMNKPDIVTPAAEILKCISVDNLKMISDMVGNQFNNRSDDDRPLDIIRRLVQSEDFEILTEKLERSYKDSNEIS